MKLFGKKKETPCCCTNACTPKAMHECEDMKKENGILILGSGCAKCERLEEATRCAVKEVGLDVTIKHITDFAQIASYGVMTTPALVYNGKVVSYGKVLSVEEIKSILVKE